MNAGKKTPNERKKKEESPNVITAKNPFDEADQTSKLSYGVFMMERNILKKRKLAVEQKLAKKLLAQQTDAV